ncbi:MAG: AarF/ABC1/UbiB kinase family protein [Parcubacteria group bacterium]
MTLPIRRLADISRILLRYGFREIGALFGQPTSELRGAEALAAGHTRAVLATAKNRPQRLRRALEELGPTFIKLGQILATRPDLIGPAYADEFAKLLDEVPPFEFARAREIVEGELGQPLDKLYAKFDERPVKSASLSQVHRAVLPDGTVVAVKVQRPDIQKIIEQDITLLKKAAEMLEKSRHVHLIQPHEIVNAFEEAITQELDFNHEAETLERFGALYQDHPLLVIPEVWRDLSSERVVTMEYIEGVKISDRETLEECGYDPQRVARNGLAVVLSQIFEHGLFHGDPHPGNIFVLPGERLAYVDFGLSGTLSRAQKRGVLKLLVSLTEKDVERALSAFRDLGVLAGRTDPDKLKPHIEALFKMYSDRPLGEIKFADLTNEIITIMRENKLRIPRDLVLLIKALATSEAVGVQLDPSFHLITEAQPYLAQALRDEVKPAALFKRIREFSRRNVEVLERAPDVAGRALDRLDQGKFTINVQHKGLDRLEKAIDVGTNQIAYGLILAALVLAGALLATIPGPQLWGVNVFSLLLFGAAILVAIGLGGSIWHERRLRRSSGKTKK